MEKVMYGTQQIKDILREVVICTRLSCTKNGKVYSPKAEEFLQWINEYTKYCIPEEVENWKRITRELIYSPIALKLDSMATCEIQRLIDSKEYQIIDDLFNFINAGVIMEMYHTTHSWDEVSDVITKQGHTGWTFSGLCNKILQFSIYGTEFIDKYYPDRINRDEEFKRVYMKAKNRKR